MPRARAGPGTPWAVALCALAALLLQTAPPWLWRAEALRPDALLAMALALSVAWEPRRALAGAFLLGLAGDMLSAGPLGMNAGMHVVLVGAALYARSILFVATPGGTLALGFAAGAAKQGAGAAMAGFAAGGGATLGGGWALAGRSAATAAYALLFAVLLGAFRAAGQEASRRGRAR